MIKVLVFNVAVVNVLVLSYLDDSVNKYYIYYGTYELKMFE
jgi:hypothetical protein